MFNSSHIELLISLEHKNYCWKTISDYKQRKILNLVAYNLAKDLGNDMYGITNTGQKMIDSLVSYINNELGISNETLTNHSI